jgi:hypothetical protein
MQFVLSARQSARERHGVIAGNFAEKAARLAALTFSATRYKRTARKQKTAEESSVCWRN